MFKLAERIVFLKFVKIREFRIIHKIQILNLC